MLKKINKYALILIVAISLFAAKAQAESFFDQFRNSVTQAGQETGHATLENKIGKTPIEIASKIIRAVLSMLGIIFLGMIVYGGYIWFIARGNDSEVKRAQLILRNAIIGLVIVTAAFVITAFVGNMLMNNQPQ